MISLDRDSFIVPGKWTARIKAAPERKYLASKRIWRLSMNAANKHFLRANFTKGEFEPAALEAVKPVGPQSDSGESGKGSGRFPANPTGLLSHQREALDKAYRKRGFAFFHEMGSGKSRTLLELWKVYFAEGLICEAWVICPNTLTGNWHEQIDIWAPELKGRIEVHGVSSLQAGALPQKLIDRAHKQLAIGIDESQTIKNFKAKRSEVVHTLGACAAYCAILTGTPITRSVGDLYSQFEAIDPRILGFKSYYSFRNRYCVMGGYENKQIVGYQNLPELLATIEPYTHTVTNPVDLPPQSHETRTVQLSKEQKRLLKELKQLMQTQLDNETLTVENALAFYTRGAQIIGGHYATDSGILLPLADNPKLSELEEILEGTGKKVVIFCRFVPEVKLIQSALLKYGAVRLDPEIEPPIDTVNRFNDDPSIRVIVSTYARGSRGFTMVGGKVLVRYSGTWEFELLVQSEKRIHRIGQDEPTLVIDLIANVMLDRHMKAVAEGKQSIADFVSNSLENPQVLTGMFDEEF